MTVLNMKKEERADYFRSLYEAARERRGEELDTLDRHMQQYLGSPEIDGSHEPALTVRNITYELIESEFSAGVPHCKVDPACYSEKRSRNARSIERLCHALATRLPFEELNDRDERYTYIYGGSVWYVEWDSEDGDGDVKINCLSPTSLVPEPGVSEIEDMDYCFIEFSTTVSEILRKYGIGVADIGSLYLDGSHAIIHYDFPGYIIGGENSGMIRARSCVGGLVGYGRTDTALSEIIDPVTTGEVVGENQYGAVGGSLENLTVKENS